MEVVGAGSPPNLQKGRKVSVAHGRWVDDSVLIGHNNEEAFGGIAIRLELVVGTVHACAAGEEKEELARAVWVVGGFGHVGFDVVEFGDLLYMPCSA